MSMLKALISAAATIVPAGLVAGATSTGVPGGTVTVWTTGVGANQHGYEVVPGFSTWSDAQAAASKAGGYLAVINAVQEDQFVDQLLTSSGATTGSYWIGLTRGASSSGNLNWVTNEPLTYTNWAPGQPDNTNGNENAGAILWDTAQGTDGFPDSGKWDDLPGLGVPSSEAPNPGAQYLKTAGYVVEFNNPQTSGSGTGSAAVPLPSAAWMFLPGVVVAAIARRRMRRMV